MTDNNMEIDGLSAKLARTLHGENPKISSKMTCLSDE